MALRVAVERVVVRLLPRDAVVRLLVPPNILSVAIPCNSILLPVVVRTMWSYYWFPPAPPLLPEPSYLMATTLQWIIYPYYYLIYVETYKAVIETWKKSLEMLTKSIEAKGAGVAG